MSKLHAEFPERMEKIDRLKGEGVALYGEKYEVLHKAADLKNNYEEEKEVKVAGRMMANRTMGKSIFADLKDLTDRIQLFVNFKILGEENFAAFKQCDIGDIIGIEGTMMTTKTGEISIRVKGFKLLSKNIRPLPEKWHGLKDVEQRYRHRYVDLIVNDAARAIFVKRSLAIRFIRTYLDNLGFLEVETPVLQQIPGGAKADPFATHHNALDLDLFLRIAPELYLKRLLVGGLEKVYEIGKNFRNEGISTRHNPEFTMLELYEAYSDYEGMMQITEDIITRLAKEVFGKETLTYNDLEIDIASPWKRISFYGALKEATGVEWRGADVRAEAKKIGVDIDDIDNDIDILDEVFDAKVQPTLINPTFIIDYPLIMTPLAKQKEDDPELVYRFELFVAHMELANAYSELNDPIEQRKRFDDQREHLGEEDKAIDEDFLTALEYGMPPAGGLGIGIDRLVMLLSGNASIREVVLFPQLKPEYQEVEQ